MSKAGLAQFQQVFIEESLEGLDTMESSLLALDEGGDGELVHTIRNLTGSRSRIVRVPGPVIPAAARVLGVALRDTLLTDDEYRSMADGLADTEGAATGETGLTQWMADHKDTLGRVYANELTRHFR